MLKLREKLPGTPPAPDALTPQIARTGSNAPPADGRFLPTCCACPVRETGACPGFGIKAEAEGMTAKRPSAIWSRVQVFPARRAILHQRDEGEFVPVICSGWAASSITIPNGRKQILALAFAGELASTHYLFDSCSGRAIEAISEVSCRMFRRRDLRALTVTTPSFAAKVERAAAEERERTDQSSLDLGRRSAEARIARLIVSLFGRLRSKGLVREGTIDFPLRQQQLADATGLTAVHVCKILSRFRASGLLRLSGRQLSVLDERGLRELVEWD